MSALVRAEKKESHIEAVTIVALIFLISSLLLCSFLHSLANQKSSNQNESETLQNKAAIVDHLSLTFPNQTFIERAATILIEAGFTVDYYPGEEVTVEFYRNLPTHGYTVIILRVHCARACLFSSESYSEKKYVYEQLTTQLLIASYAAPKPPYYFAITPDFVTYGMNGKFQETTIIMMGCEGLTNSLMAEALEQRGAKVYLGWNARISSTHTDCATIHLLEHLFIQGQTVEQAAAGTMREVGPDPTPSGDSTLQFYPTEAGGYRPSKDE